MRSSIVARDRVLMTEALDRAVARGEIQRPADDIVTTVPVAMMFARVLLMDEPLDDDYLVRLVDHVVLPLFQR